MSAEFLDPGIFRLLPVVTTGSFIYDTFYLFKIQNLKVEGKNMYGGEEYDIKMLSLTMVWITWLLKPFLVVLLWKLSVNFIKDVVSNPEMARHMKLMFIADDFRISFVHIHDKHKHAHDKHKGLKN